jgi:hypothetical protein
VAVVLAEQLRRNLGIREHQLKRFYILCNVCITHGEAVISTPGYGSLNPHGPQVPNKKLMGQCFFVFVSFATFIGPIYHSSLTKCKRQINGPAILAEARFPPKTLSVH